MSRKDYNNDFEFVREEGELVFAKDDKTFIVFQSGEFWVLEGVKGFHDFADWLGFDTSPIPYILIPCIIKKGEFWEQRLLHNKECLEIARKITARREEKDG